MIPFSLFKTLRGRIIDKSKELGARSMEHRAKKIKNK
jgi:hypothetical protein